ncbi:transposase [Achromobacter ruhlandii]|uniref:transposase n=1 Tax=Achromobacter ruhlandii TaxID=72557 RepID=UPI00387E6C3E
MITGNCCPGTGAAGVRRWPWVTKYPTIVATWQRAWITSHRSSCSRRTIRRVIYTTNAIESLSMQLLKIIKTRGHFPQMRPPSSSYGWRYATCWPSPSGRPSTGKPQ